MKIAYLGIKGLPSKGGAERVVEAVTRRLSSQHEITVYCDRNYTPREEEIPGIRLVRLPTMQGKHSRMFILDILASLHALIWGDYDLIHLHNAETGFVIPLLRLRYKVVSTSHALTYTVEKWGRLSRWFMRLAEIPFLYLSNAVTSVTPVFVPYYSKFRPVHVITNGIELDQPVCIGPAKAILEEFNIDPGTYIMFAAGRIIPFKGCHLLLDAYIKLACQAPLLIVGDLQQMPEYADQLLSKGCGEQVHFLPFISGQGDVLGLVKQAGLFVFPSTNKEAMSMMLLEVASIGAPLLCSDIPQNVTVLGNNGYYFRSDDSDDLAEKLIWAIDHSKEMQITANRCMAHVRENFSWDLIAAQYDELYKQVSRKANHSSRNN
jgi:glycosyltransferase involved in cell wall biosynthesis